MRANGARIIPTEEEDHIAIVAWSKTKPILRDYLFHPPNGGSRHPLEAVKLKKMGVVKGVSDFFLAYPSNNYHGLWLELKRKGLTIKSVTKEQLEWLNKMRSLGYEARVAFGYDEAVKCFTQYLMECN